MKYGPNTAEIEALIEKIGSLTPEQAERLGAARDAARGAARGAARDAVRDVVRGTAWRAAWDAVWDADQDAARDAARGAAWDASLALLVKDLISEEHFDTLYGPWDSVMN